MGGSLIDSADCIVTRPHGVQMFRNIDGTELGRIGRTRNRITAGTGEGRGELIARSRECGR